MKKDLRNFGSLEVLLVSGLASRGVVDKICQNKKKAHMIVFYSVSSNVRTKLNALCSCCSAKSWSGSEKSFRELPPFHPGCVNQRKLPTLPGRSGTFAFYPELANLCHRFNQQTSAQLKNATGARTAAALIRIKFSSLLLRLPLLTEVGQMVKLF